MQRKTNLRGLDVHHVQNGTHGRIINGKLFIEILSNGLFHTRGLSMTMGFASMYISRLIVLSRSHNLLHPLCFILPMLGERTCRFVNYLPRSRVWESHTGIVLASTINISTDTFLVDERTISYNHSHSSCAKDINQERFQSILLCVCSPDNKGCHGRNDD